MRTHGIRTTLCLLTVVGVASIQISDSSRSQVRWGAAAHAGCLNTKSFKTILSSGANCLKTQLKNAVSGVKKLPGLMKTLTQDLGKFASMSKDVASCLVKGMKDLPLKLVRSPGATIKGLVSKTLSAGAKWVQTIPGDLYREMAGTGQSIIGIVKGVMGNAKKVSIKGLLKLIGDAVHGSYKMVRGQLDRHYELFFKRLNLAKDIWPVGCMLKAKPLIDKMMGPVIKVLFDKFFNLVKGLYDKDIVEKVPPLLEKLLLKVARMVIKPEMIGEVFLDNLADTDRQIASLLGNGQGPIDETKAAEAAKLLDPSQYINGVNLAKKGASVGKSVVTKLGTWAFKGVKLLIKAVAKVVNKVVQWVWKGSPPKAATKVTSGLDKAQQGMEKIQALAGNLKEKLGKLTEKLQSPLEALLDKAIKWLDLKIAGILLPVIDWIAAQVAGLVVPLILEVVTVEVGGLGALSSILTALVHNIVVKFLVEVYNDIVWPFVFDKPIRLVLQKIGDLIVQGVKTVVKVVEGMVNSGAKEVTGIIRDKVMNLVPLPGVIVKFLGMIDNVMMKIGDERAAKLKRQADLVGGLLVDLAKKGGKVCGMKVTNVPEPPRMGFFELQTKLMKFVFNKLIGQKK